MADYCIFLPLLCVSACVRKVGDKVRVRSVEVSAAEATQTSAGGWCSAMAVYVSDSNNGASSSSPSSSFSFSSAIATVVAVSSSGTRARLLHVNGDTWTWHTELLHRLETITVNAESSGGAAAAAAAAGSRFTCPACTYVNLPGPSGKRSTCEKCGTNLTHRNSSSSGSRGGGNSSDSSSRKSRKAKAEGVRFCVLNDARPIGKNVKVTTFQHNGQSEPGGGGGVAVGFGQMPLQGPNHHGQSQDGRSGRENAQGVPRAVLVQVPKALASAAIALLRAAAAVTASSDAAAHPSRSAPPFAFRVVAVRASDDSSAPSSSLLSAAAAPPPRSCAFVRAIVAGASPKNQNGNHNHSHNHGHNHHDLPGLRALAAPPLGLLSAARDNLRGAHSLRHVQTTGYPGGGGSSTAGDTGLVLTLLHAGTFADRSRATVAALKRNPSIITSTSAHPLCVRALWSSCSSHRQSQQHYHGNYAGLRATAPSPQDEEMPVMDVSDDDQSVNRSFACGAVFAVVPRQANDSGEASAVTSKNNDGKYDLVVNPFSSSSSSSSSVRQASVLKLKHLQPNRQVSPFRVGQSSSSAATSATSRVRWQFMELELCDLKRYQAAMCGPATTPAAAAVGEAPSGDEVELPLAAAVLSPVEHHFGECTVCYEFIAKDAFANFCFREFRIDADSLQVRSPRTVRAAI